MDFDVESIVSTRFQARAKAASAAHKEEMLAAQEEERDILEQVARDCMRDILDLPEADIADTIFERGVYSGVRQKIVFHVDGIKFQVRYESKRMSFKDDEGNEQYDLVPRLEMWKSASWVPIKHLWEVGDRL